MTDTRPKPNRKERRTNLANVRKQRRKFMRTRGPSVAPLIGNVVDPGHETELTEDAKHLNKEAPINQGVEANG